jgi:hypothetical protein
MKSEVRNNSIRNLKYQSYLLQSGQDATFDGDKRLNKLSID